MAKNYRGKWADHLLTLNINSVLRFMNKDSIKNLMSLLNNHDKAISHSIISCLIKLNYLPQKQKVRGYVLNFKSRQTGQTIAKIGVRDGKNQAFYSLKFFACKNPPTKYKVAIQNAIIAENERYTCVDCGVCKVPAGERGYIHVYPNGRSYKRCSAYVVEIPSLHIEDVDNFNRLIEEQHQYFLSIVGVK